ncbi:MAG: cutinase family protein [Candidatus Nanopelagicales bacterium]
MRMRFGRVVLVASVMAAVSAIVPAPTAGAAPACAPVLVLGARGSGEPQSGSASDAGSGLGQKTYDAAVLLRQRIPGASVESVQYPAASMAVLAADTSAYFGGLEQGVSWTRERIARSGTECPGQRIVLMGYSQGAMVMHRVVQDLVAAGDTAALSRIDGAVLMGDGDRDASDGIRAWGSARKGTGLARQFPSLSGARSTALPRSVARRVQSVCDRGDTVCDATGASGPARTPGDVHTRHYTATKPVRGAVDVVVRNARASLRSAR